MSDLELSKSWLEAYALKQQGKALTAIGGVPLVDVLEKSVFEEAEDRIDSELTKRKMLKKAEHIIFERK